MLHIGEDEYALTPNMVEVNRCTKKVHGKIRIHYVCMNERFSLFTQTCVNVQGRSYLEV